MTNITITEKLAFTAKEISNFIKRVFDETVKAEFSQEGIENFYKYIEPQKISERIRDKDVYFFAINKENNVLGIIELFEKKHIKLFFVDTNNQGKGIGKKLLSRVLEVIEEKNPQLKKLTVNASPNSVDIYKKLKFKTVGGEQEAHGIRFTPMIYKILDHA